MFYRFERDNDIINTGFERQIMSIASKKFEVASPEGRGSFNCFP
jgi:hypothetical protein